MEKTPEKRLFYSPKSTGLGFGHFRTRLQKTQALEMTCIQGWILGLLFRQFSFSEL